ncbi:MAG: hypothetical protein LBH60_03060 [Prevotellaceae bacterium]|nr:hypothetical protein [Prevotellaceae bacterium]
MSEVVFAGQAPLVFHTEGALSGPSLLLNGETLRLTGSDGKYSGASESLDYKLEYSAEGGQLAIKVNCRNRGASDLNGLQFSLQLGLNTEMTSFPAWRTTYFPTLLHCEQTHFWGYLMNPDGNIVTLASPDPVASYRLAYNNYVFDWPYEFGSGHLIRTVTLDLLNPQPLPDGHPRNADRLRKGESKSWTVYLGSVRELSDVIPATAALTGAATVTADVYTVAEGETVRLTVYSAAKPKITAFAPNGEKLQIRLSKAEDGVYRAVFAPSSGKGVYRLTSATGGKTSEACVSVRYPWSDYIASARRTALKYRQKASSHDESWLGFIPASVAEEYFPDKEMDAKVEDMYREVFPLMYDTVTHLPTSWHNRIQNHAIAASLHVQRYKAKKDENELRAAARVVDFLMTKQSSDGAYRNEGTHYTCVHYIAKSIMEVMAEEKKLAATSIEWDANYRRHYYSVALAMNELAKNGDNIQTEGEHTFEDGMIACSCAQLSMFALIHPKGSAERSKYVKAAEYMYNSHRCLSQHLIPDSRIHGASIRFWESQYDILTCPNFINSPHGWSAWRIYGAKYLYEATGKETYLLDIMSALGACAQLLDPSTDHLNWAFVCDPYVKVKYFVEDERNPGKGVRRDSIIGRQYLPMISHWYRAPKNEWVSGYWKYDGGCCDNDVNEIFKCMGEIALTSAYFHLCPDGSCITWNCSASLSDGKWQVSPSEPCVTTVYSNVDIRTEKGIFVKNINREDHI